MGGHNHPREKTDVYIGHAQTEVASHVRPHEGWNTEEIAKWITPGPRPGGDEDTTWRKDWYMHGAEDLIRCCTQGFPLRYEGDRSRDVEQANGKMCQDNPDITAAELQKEVAAGRIHGPYTTQPLPGFKTVPRGLKEEPTKFRPLSQGNQPFGDAVNESIPKVELIELTRTQDIDRKISAV